MKNYSFFYLFASSKKILSKWNWNTWSVCASIVLKSKKISRIQKPLSNFWYFSCNMWKFLLLIIVYTWHHLNYTRLHTWMFATSEHKRPISIPRKNVQFLSSILLSRCSYYYACGIISKFISYFSCIERPMQPFYQTHFLVTNYCSMVFLFHWFPESDF